MKNTGIIRKVDELGRVVIPKEIRRIHNINVGDPMEVFVDCDTIVLKKYSPGCLFCNSVDKENMLIFASHNICRECLDRIKTIINN